MDRIGIDNLNLKKYMESNKFTKFYGYFVKLKKIQPEHGNVMDPGLPYCGFEGCDVVT